MSQLNPLIMPDWLTSLRLMLISPAERTASHTVKMPKWAHTTIQRDYNLHTWQILLPSALSGAVNVACCCHSTRPAIENLEGAIKMPWSVPRSSQWSGVCLSRKTISKCGCPSVRRSPCARFSFNMEQLVPICSVEVCSFLWYFFPSLLWEEKEKG